MYSYYIILSDHWVRLLFQSIDFCRQQETSTPPPPTHALTVVNKATITLANVLILAHLQLVKRVMQNPMLPRFLQCASQDNLKVVSK